MKKSSLVLATLGALAISASALAADHEVQMLNTGADGVMVFEPGFLKVAPGDSVTFVATDPAHNAASEYVPAGAQSWAGAMNETITVTLEQEGVYIYKCDPHVPLGMVGVIQVGAATNLDEAQQAATDFKGSIAANKDRLDQYL